MTPDFQPAQISIEYLIGTANVGGAEKQLLQLCEQLADHDIDIAVTFMRFEGGLRDRFTKLPIQINDVGFTGISRSRLWKLPTLRSVRAVIALARFRLKRQAPPTVYHAILDGAIALAPLIRRYRRNSTVFVVGIRGFREFSPSFKRFHHALFVRSLMRASAVVCNAPHLLTEIQQNYNVEPSRLFCIPNGLALDVPMAKPELSPALGIVVANFHSYKGYDTLLEAIGILGTRSPRFRLCGNGLTTALSSVMKEPTVGIKIEIAPQDAVIQAELAASQMLVHPSHTEGLSNAILEGLAAGLPIIACQIGSNPLLVDHGINGLLVPPGDAHALALAIEELSNNPELRRKMGSESRRKAEMFSWDACASAYAELYRKVAGELSK